MITCGKTTGVIERQKRRASTHKGGIFHLYLRLSFGGCWHRGGGPMDHAIVKEGPVWHYSDLDEWTHVHLAVCLVPCAFTMGFNVSDVPTRVLFDDATAFVADDDPMFGGDGGAVVGGFKVGAQVHARSHADTYAHTLLPHTTLTHTLTARAAAAQGGVWHFRARGEQTALEWLDAFDTALGSIQSAVGLHLRCLDFW